MTDDLVRIAASPRRAGERRCGDPAAAILVALVAIACGTNTPTSHNTPQSSDPPQPQPEAQPQLETPALPLPDFTDPPREPAPARATQVALGSNFGCARMSDDTMRCWGDNGWHQLGVDPDQHPPGAVVTPPVTDVVQVAAGQTLTCVRKRDRTVWCWGYDLYGQLGKADRAIGHTPVQIAGLADVVDLEAGDRNACAVRVDGTLWCWGDNTYHQLGDGTNTARLGPVRAPVDAITSVTVGGGVCARRADGALWCWSDNFGKHPAPVPVGDVVRASLGGTACAVSGGAAICWGANDSGQLGRDDPAALAPGPVANLKDVTWVAAQRYHACAIAAGTVYCWGREGSHPAFPADCMRLTRHTGGPGGGSVANWNYCPVPTPIPAIEQAVAVELPWDGGGCALTQAGAVHCWDGAAVRELAL